MFIQQTKVFWFNTFEHLYASNDINFPQLTLNKGFETPQLPGVSPAATKNTRNDSSTVAMAMMEIAKIYSYKMFKMAKGCEGDRGVINV